MTLRKHELSGISLRLPQAQWRRQLMVISHPAWLPFGAAVEQPRQGASGALVQPLGNRGERYRRLGLQFIRQRKQQGN